jgi:nucleoside-diphosphate-sugar epimerase
LDKPFSALVTGGAGFIGSHLVEALTKICDRIIVLDDFSSGTKSNLSHIDRGIEIVEGSICSLPLVKYLVSQVDVVYHLATRCLVEGLENPQIMHEVNDVGTYNVCLAAKESPRTKIVYIQSSEAYGRQKVFPIKETVQMNPVSIYGITKLIGERYVSFFNKIYGVPAVTIRVFNCFGPHQREDEYAAVITNFMKKIEKNEQPIIYGDGTQTRDFSYVTDVVDGILALHHLKNGEIVNVGSGKEVSLNDVADMVVQTWSQNPKAKANTIHAEARIEDITRLQADISLAESYGWKPKISFKEGVKKYVQYYKAKHLEWWKQQ